jgi:hypothetical protein
MIIIRSARKLYSKSLVGNTFNNSVSEFMTLTLMS